MKSPFLAVKLGPSFLSVFTLKPLDPTKLPKLAPVAKIHPQPLRSAHLFNYLGPVSTVTVPITQWVVGDWKFLSTMLGKSGIADLCSVVMLPDELGTADDGGDGASSDCLAH